MTRLDRAFIRLYADREESLPTRPDPDKPAPEEDPPGDPLAPPAAEAATAVSPGEVLPTRPDAAPGPTDEQPGEPGSVHRLDPAVASASAALPAEGRSVPPPHLRILGAAVDDPADAAADAVGTEDQSADDEPEEPTFEAMLQVDRFDWPVVCSRLGQAAAGELGRLADRLVRVMARGERVVAIGGCRRGEGATTLLLCIGRRLAELGLNVVMADANLANPQLGDRLGLAPESGWEDVLAGRLPLEEVVIESIDDRLALLPVRQGAGDTEPLDERRLIESIETLADHYDLVLLDPGPLEDLGTLGASLARGIGSRLDAIALVHHRRLTPREDLDEVRRWLTATEISQLGVIENFLCE